MCSLPLRFQRNILHVDFGLSILLQIQMTTARTHSILAAHATVDSVSPPFEVLKGIDQLILISFFFGRRAKV